MKEFLCYYNKAYIVSQLAKLTLNHLCYYLILMTLKLLNDLDPSDDLDQSDDIKLSDFITYGSNTAGVKVASFSKFFLG